MLDQKDNISLVCYINGTKFKIEPNAGTKN